MICKICKKKKIKEVLNLGLQPLANKYPKNQKEFTEERKFPLNLFFCSNCLNVQIKKIISRKEMFEDYYYLSSVNKGLVIHFKQLAKKIKNSSFVVDIGSNDGILLKPLKSMGVRALGVDPSVNVGKIANDNGFKTLVSFFNKNIVNKIINQYEKPDTIIASSVFTHIENPLLFAKNIKKLIKKNGFFILEVEYLTNFIKNIQFERFYFDRPFYYSLNSIKILFEQVGMSLVNIDLIETHGGSIRCFIKNKKNEKSSNIVNKMLKKEREELTNKKFKIFNEKIIKEAKKFKQKLQYYKKLKKKVIGYGAPARVSTITNYSKINKQEITYIIDDNPIKQNRFTPGMHIPIVNRKKNINNDIDVVIVFAYEYFKEIKKHTKKLKCDYFKPIPFKKLI